MPAVNLSKSLSSAAPLIVAGGAALLCGLIGLIVFLILARRQGRSRGRSLLGVASGLLTVTGVGLLGREAFALAAVVNVELAKLRIWFKMGRDAINYMEAQEIRALLDSPKHREPKDLNRHEYRVFSQN